VVIDHYVAELGIVVRSALSQPSGRQQVDKDTHAVASLQHEVDFTPSRARPVLDILLGSLGESFEPLSRVMEVRDCLNKLVGREITQQKLEPTESPAC
jgi:hypothetical protein